MRNGKNFSLETNAVGKNHELKYMFYNIMSLHDNENRARAHQHLFVILQKIGNSGKCFILGLKKRIRKVEYVN